MIEDILTPFVERSGITVYKGDCVETMRRMPEASVDAIVTDPPYGLEFMGKDWDAPWKNDGDVLDDPASVGGFQDGAGGNPYSRSRIRYGRSSGFQEWTESWAREAFRILKPGGHLLAFAGTRTYHRMASGVEDAGFEIRDCIAWMYGSGFPKSLDVSKAIDKGAGHWRGKAGSVYSPNGSMAGPNYERTEKGEPVTPAAAKWSGWGTALKPAFEPIVVARKPLIGTVAQNVLEHGTGALNIDATRIGWAYDGEADEVDKRTAPNTRGSERSGNVLNRPSAPTVNVNAGGRWPANVALDETSAAILDEQSGEIKSVPFKATTERAQADRQNVSFAEMDYSGRGYTDTGGASRFFYCAKASKRDRNTNGAVNTHPTVKPTELMRWLIRLVTPPGGIILDPFGGSGSTGVAAQADSVRCILIEREDEYLQIIRDRLDDGSLFSELA
jgi:site-specific DNA-methyltransferase (adenine-specific)